VAPRAAYSSSKFEAERGLQAMAGKDFCPVILRKGTIYGFSPRLRYDLVVNTFVKDALSKGTITMHFGGQMWRPLLDVRDAARAYIAALEAPDDKVRGQVFNVVYENFRISELALRVRETLRGLGVNVDVHPDYAQTGVRSYRISGEKMDRVLGFRPTLSLEESLKDLYEKVTRNGYTDWHHPIYYNIAWMRMLEQAHSIIGVTGSVFGTTADHQSVRASVRSITAAGGRR
jgi:nucleoside-diphosphate-sugar epimerase